MLIHWEFCGLVGRILESSESSQGYSVGLPAALSGMDIHIGGFEMSLVIRKE